MSTPTRLRLFLLLIVPSIIGCGNSSISEDTVSSSEQAYNAAQEDLASSNAEAAVERFTQAIQGGGLQPDQLADAYLKRAIAHANIKKFDQAFEDVTSAEQAAHPADILRTKAAIHELMGDTDKAKAAITEAIKQGGRQ